MWPEDTIPSQYGWASPWEIFGKLQRANGIIPRREISEICDPQRLHIEIECEG